ncbi:hypothetical protein PQX77_000884 [Marasmius sp. AFHP31]|nr:hypothetical protein PQX77_000884 [Marasmius sp. AFHP31]
MALQVPPSHCVRCALQDGGTITAEQSTQSAEFTRLSTSNEPPSSFACELFRPRYAQTIETLKILDSQIEKLREERARIKEQSRLYASILHPIRNLPPELLTEIFRICTASHTKEPVQDDIERSDSFLGSLNTCKAPWVLGQVCRTWREVAISAADLWTRVEVPWRKLEAQLSNQRLASLKCNLMLQLERSRTQPLAIVYGADMNTVEGALPLILKFHSQWEDVFLEGDVRVFRYLHPYRGRFPKLKTLRLSLKGHGENDVTGAFDDLPSLERLTLADDVEYLLRSEDQLPWKRVMHYTSRESISLLPDIRDSYSLLPDIGEQSRILPRLVNIHTCVIESITQSDVVIPELTPPLNLKFLHTLVLSQEYDSVIGILLDWLILPALRVLRLSQSFDYPRALIDFLDRSSCQLEELVVTDTHYGLLRALDGLVQVLKASSLRSLRTFGVGGVCTSNSLKMRDAWDRILNALTPTEDNTEPNVLPNLQRLILCGPQMEWTDEILLKMVSARCQERVGYPATVEGAGMPRRLEELVFAGFVNEEMERLGTGYRYLLTEDGADKIADLCAEGLVCRAVSGVDWYKV